MKTGQQVPRFDIGQIIRNQHDFISNSKQFTAHQKRMLKAISECRTSALGRHKVACTDCGTIQIAYNSCRNRNCPKCQNTQRNKWVEARSNELLPVPYFHLVFTLPSGLNNLCLHFPNVMYRLLFHATWYTINKLGHDETWVGAQLGMVAILHTWGSNLSLHPHLHCMVPAGGLDNQGNWKSSRSKGNYLFNRGVMGVIFRARYIKLLRKAIKNKELPPLTDAVFNVLFSKEWITYAKRPFKGPKQVLNYIGRYSHKIAITNYRIQKVTDKQVWFTYKNYRKEGKQQLMKLTQQEFVRRFAMHIVPYKFVRIRHNGILSNRSKKESLAKARAALGVYHAPTKLRAKIVFENGLYPHFCGGCLRVTPHVLIDVLPPVRGSPITPKGRDTSNWLQFP